MAIDENKRKDDHPEKTEFLATEQITLNQELEKARGQEACLILIRGTPQGHRYFITQDEMLIGRDPDCAVSVQDTSISRKHAKLPRKGTDIFYVDLGSQNGTLINGKKIMKGQTVKLSKEDMIRLGRAVFKFLPAGEIEILFYGNLGHAAYTDPLTQVYNKRYLMEALDAEFKRARALHGDLSLIFLDIDHFKNINDTFGHDAGDFVLKELTTLMRNEMVREKDIFARYGGEEFVMVLPETPSSVALEIAEKIRSEIQMHAFIYDGKRIPTTSSFGVAEMNLTLSTPQSLLKAADRALYISKTEGRNRVSLAR